ncbi:peptide-methionine (S)-S-oxide reductase [Corynebacterium sp. 13CS0277]|uniref:peptide-methionine (S)-S-oxide reductase MsrA n=1 Tax=Corynebacterium sp. 13CS0277 TaxID=2071994 RepID=UPI000D026496|nr:peptide-methionine (S)-S-oxide reductase MsrA [Corynebacterium sp. 13CS0277]PRQ10473.1 peptide-methionine (S)-S-oxide reductase [Corynebacterium sp. 13CS0277]
MGWLFGNPGPVTAETALKGGRHPVLPDPQPHVVLGTPIADPVTQGQGEIFVGMGCFWGAEKLLWQLPGVVTTAVGYAGGFTPNPTYRETCTGRTGHTEIVRVVFDRAVTDAAAIALAALEGHDPTQVDRQGNDVGTQYRSALYVTTPEDLAAVKDVVRRYGEALAAAGYPPIATEVMLLQDTPAGEFYLAEDYHQQYLEKNPGGYCPHHATGVCLEG